MARPPESVVHGSQAPQTAAHHPVATALPQQLPALDKLLRLPGVAAAVAAHGHTLVADTGRALLADWRVQALAGALPLDAVAPAALASSTTSKERSMVL